MMRGGNRNKIETLTNLQQSLHIGKQFQRRISVGVCTINHVRHLTTKMIRKGRSAKSEPERQDARFTMARAMVLASTDFKQRSGITSAASYLMDGHSVDLSKELVEQKPSILQSQEWDTSHAPPPKSQANPGIIRVCWQFPEKVKNRSRSGLASRFVD
jgi:hypothetical protein